MVSRGRAGWSFWVRAKGLGEDAGVRSLVLGRHRIYSLGFRFRTRVGREVEFGPGGKDSRAFGYILWF